VLVGYYVLDCAELDQAVQHASRAPVARYGSVEVRPIVAEDEIPRPGRSEPMPVDLNRTDEFRSRRPFDAVKADDDDDWTIR
jgi:hypothetical protein